MGERGKEGREGGREGGREEGKGKVSKIYNCNAKKGEWCNELKPPLTHPHTLPPSLSLSYCVPSYLVSPDPAIWGAIVLHQFVQLSE